MTQRAVEVVLGRLATDEAMRRRFMDHPGQVLRELASLGLELSAVERAALEMLDGGALAQFAEALDARIQKAELVHQDVEDAGGADGDAGPQQEAQ